MGWLCWPQSAAPHTHLTLQASQYLGQNTAVAIFLQNILKQLDLSCNKIQHQDAWDLSPAEGRAAVALSCAWEGVTCTNKPTSQSLLAKGVLLQLLLFNWCVVINKSWGWSRKHYSRWQDRLLILGTTPCFADSVGVLHWQSLADLPALAQGFIPMSGAWERRVLSLSLGLYPQQFEQGELHSAEGWSKSFQPGCSTVQGAGSLPGDRALGSLGERTGTRVPPLPAELWHQEDTWLTQP